jgi:hypothetical protein
LRLPAKAVTYLRSRLSIMFGPQISCRRGVHFSSLSHHFSQLERGAAGDGRHLCSASHFLPASTFQGCPIILVYKLINFGQYCGPFLGSLALQLLLRHLSSTKELTNLKSSRRAVSGNKAATGKDVRCRPHCSAPCSTMSTIRFVPLDRILNICRPCEQLAVASNVSLHLAFCCRQNCCRQNDLFFVAFQNVVGSAQKVASADLNGF